MKATVVLLPLLSITSILFIWAPDVQKSPTANLAYRITNACLQVAQVSFCRIICFSRKSRLLEQKKIETESASGINIIFKHMPGFACFTLFYHHLTTIYIVLFPSCCIYHQIPQKNFLSSLCRTMRNNRHTLYLVFPGCLTIFCFLIFFYTGYVCLGVVLLLQWRSEISADQALEAAEI